MAIDKEEIPNRLQDMGSNIQTPDCPAFLLDERLEDAFRAPACNEEGYSEPLPTIWKNYSYGEYQDGTLFITLKSASINSNLYSKYLDEEALVWDSINERLLLYTPDPEKPRIAFKGSNWQYAKRLKPEYEDYITLRDVYCELTTK